MKQYKNDKIANFVYYWKTQLSEVQNRRTSGPKKTFIICTALK